MNSCFFEASPHRPHLSAACSSSRIERVFSVCTDAPHPRWRGRSPRAFVASGYLLPFIKGTEVLVGLVLLSGRYVPLALTVSLPSCSTSSPSTRSLPRQASRSRWFFWSEIYLASTHRAAFAPLFQVKTAATDRHTIDRTHLATAS